mmetsp:Transcript_84119/g.167878  ORF Transcript_84119/g.167878 Transcript_84119/m.167878 type:complete len:100 (-) Transcript_84119:114-413(-)
MTRPLFPQESLNELLDPVLPGLLDLLLSHEIIHECNYTRLIREDDEDEYTNLMLWKARNLEFFHFIILSKLPVPPAWCIDSMFIIKVASIDADETEYNV